MRTTAYGLVILSLFLVTGIGCGGGGGTDKTEVPLDTSTQLGFLRSEDEGLFPDDSVLDNPNNPSPTRPSPTWNLTSSSTKTSRRL
jgi:hypothetical protein